MRVYAYKDCIHMTRRALMLLLTTVSHCILCVVTLTLLLRLTDADTDTIGVGVGIGLGVNAQRAIVNEDALPADQAFVLSGIYSDRFWASTSVADLNAGKFLKHIVSV
jgi:hypothetical protein